MNNSSLFLSAGDLSGDNASSLLLSELQKLKPRLTCFGLGGRKLKKLGQRQLAESDKLAVIGFWEVAKHFLYFRRLMRDCVAEIEKNKPKCIVLVDYPGFNLRLAARVKKFGIPIIYYISPQVWAWGKKRVKQIREQVDLMIPILPFEKDFFNEHQVNCEFVGHYLLEDIPSELIKSPLAGNKKIGLLPGSRPQEIERILPAMLEAAAICNAKHGTTASVAGISSVFDYDSILKRHGVSGISVVYDRARELIAESDVIITASGTATLETAIIGRPMVVVYKTGWLTYQIARRLVKLDSIALANLVISKKILPELIQNDMSPQKISAEVDRFLTDSDYYNDVYQQLLKVPDKLGGRGASARVAALIAEYL